MKDFRSVFADRLSSYVNLRRGLGFKYEAEEAILKMFDKNLCRRGYKGSLTQELAIAFATQNPEVSTNYRFQLYTVARHFSEYLAAFDPKTPILDPKALPRTKARSCAHIFTDEEIVRLLDEARRIFPKLPMLGITLYTIVGMAASTGLRISEVIALAKADVDLDTGIMTIRNSKMGKSRLVPLHPTTLEVMRSYGALRDTHYPDCDSPAFFVNSRGGRFRQNNLQVNFWKLACKAGVRTAKGKGPSFHSLRHTFATNRLVAWYKGGMDVQALLPALATYMGHVHYSDTAYYIKATPELLGLVADRCHDRLSSQEVQP